MLLIDFFDKGVGAFPDRLIVQSEHGALTHREMDLLSRRVAAAIMAAGIKPDANVAIYSPNHIHCLTAFYGAIRAGAVWVPVNYRFVSADVLETINDLDVQFLFFHSTLVPHVKEVLNRISTMKGCVCLDQNVDFAPSLTDWITPFAGAENNNFPQRKSTDAVVMLTTSGTTGKPKGVMLSNRAYSTMIASFRIRIPPREVENHLVVSPLTHATGVYSTCLLSRGGTNFIVSEPDPLGVMEAIQKFGITTLFLPPTLIYMMLAHPKVREFDFSSLRSMLYGGAPMSAQKLREAMMIFGAIMYQIYGQSEALMICTMMTAADHQYALENKQYEGRLWSAGREGPFARVEIMDESGNILSPEQPGEVVVRSDLVMECYYRNPEATAEVSAHGWHHTGDVGRKDQDGFLYIMDRRKDMIISGGFNIFPTEVERALLTHPSIQDCAVVGVPDEKWGEAVLAAVELKQGASASTEEIIAYCKERLGSLKAPKKVEFVETLIRSTNGKVLRREVRAKYWKGRERNV